MRGVFELVLLIALMAAVIYFVSEQESKHIQYMQREDTRIKSCADQCGPRPRDESVWFSGCSCKE